MRKASLRAAVILLPLIATGQQQTTAAEAETALRARVTQFMQYHVDGNFRKAYDMVADDTKDEYFGSGKVQLLSFKIDGIKFTDNFTKATVTATISKTTMILDQVVDMTLPSTSTWKIENGNWVWYNDSRLAASFVPQIPGLAPAGPKVSQSPNNDSTDVALPKGFDEKTVAAAAQSILQQVGVDRNQVTLASNQPSEDRVIFHNGMPGAIQLELSVPEIPGFSAKLDQSIVRANGDVPVVFRYEPGAQNARREPITVQILAQPLNQTFAIRVSFSAAAPAKPK